MGKEALVTAALAGEPELRDLVAAALATKPTAGQDAPGWLRSLDARWGDAATWRRLGRAAEVPEQFTEVLYIYTGSTDQGPWPIGSCSSATSKRASAAAHPAGRWSPTS